METEMTQGLEELRAGITSAKPYRGGTVPKAVWQTRSDTRPLVPGRPQAKRLRPQDPRTTFWLMRKMPVEY